MFIGFACLPQRFQPLPKEHQCTIIGWGKRKNTDEVGTNLLHEAEVCPLRYMNYVICII